MDMVFFWWLICYCVFFVPESRNRGCSLNDAPL